MNRKERFKLIKEAEKRRYKSVGVKLRDLAFQRRPEDWDEVIELLSILQKRKINGESLFGDDYEAIEIAQAFVREVQQLKKPSQSK